MQTEIEICHPRRRGRIAIRPYGGSNFNMTKYDSKIHHRRSIRVKGYDYTKGWYFVTICAHDKKCLFGDVTSNGEMRLNEFGEFVESEWLRTMEIRQNVDLDIFMVM